MGILQRFLQAIDRSRSILHQAHPVTGQFAEFSLPGEWNGTAFEQPMWSQVRHPFRITHISLASRYRFERLRVDHQEFEMPF